jgi:anti-anti-sigma regulatory factor
MKIKRDETSGRLRITGAIFADGIAPLRAALLESLAAGEEVTVDLSTVDMCNTSAIQVLIACRRSAGSIGKPCRILPSPFLRETVAALGLPSVALGEVALGEVALGDGSVASTGVEVEA